MKNDEFYLVKTKLGDCEVSHEERERFIQTRCCPECHYIRKGVTAVNGIQLESRSDELDKPLELGVKTGMVWNEFLAPIPKEIVERDLWLGSLLGPDGKPLEGWSTFNGRYKLYVRGTRGIINSRGTTEIETHPCGTCGLVRYFAMGKYHLYPKPPEDADIFQGGVYSLIFRASVFQLLDIQRWKKALYVARIPVLDKPLDGVELPPFFEPER
ncbi:MAG: hypothetical protein PHE53_14165 [Thermoguttaceae bacterium]|nr:hypothetical protein [Thermoguttaceae bacterium]